MTRAYVLRLCVCALAALGPAACAGGGQAPQDSYYRVDAGAPPGVLNGGALGGGSLNGVLAVERFAAEGLTAGRAIVYVDPKTPNQMKQYFYHHWSEPPNVMLRDELVRYLRAANAAETIVTPEIRVEPGYALSGRIHALERRLGDSDTAPDTAVVELEFALAQPATGRLLLNKTYKAEVPAAGGTLDDSVAAFNEGLSDIFARLAADLPGG
ncbi:MAG: ABC-type transport auxiliary lipoprotein family protein [Rhodospirillales bacterium]